MFQVTIYLVACLMGLSSVMGQEPLVLPPFVNGFKYQCQARGAYVGACTAQSLLQRSGFSGFRCDKLVCAKMILPDVYEAVENGMVLDGTKCATNRICSRGQCVFIGNQKIPFQIGPGPQYLCQSPPVPTAVVHPQARNTTPRTSTQSQRTPPTVIVYPRVRNTTPRTSDQSQRTPQTVIVYPQVRNTTPRTTDQSSTTVDNVPASGQQKKRRLE